MDNMTPAEEIFRNDRKSKTERMSHLVLMLNEASKRYYTNTENGPAMSDKLYDKMFAELTQLEWETGIIFSDSPTKRVGFREDEGKIKHDYPVLSLKDTKSTDELLYFIKEEEAVLSWKLDGVSIMLYYDNGHLTRAVSRGDGYTGKDITENVRFMRDVPKILPGIPLKDGRMIIRGEGCLTLSEFNAIKKTKQGERYSNPRNLASGIINSKRASSTLLRHMTFVAHGLVQPNDIHTTRSAQYEFMTDLGFEVVPYSIVSNYELLKEIEEYTSRVEYYDFPVDGLVLTLNDISLGEAMGSTARFPRHSLAFKWPDEYKFSKVTGMKWSVSLAGLITPVVIFEPITLEGTMVQQANLHSLKIFEDLQIGRGDVLKVFKANKIIPEIEENMTRSGTEVHPDICPACGNKTSVVESKNTKKLYCYTCLRKYIP